MTVDGGRTPPSEGIVIEDREDRDVDEATATGSALADETTPRPWRVSEPQDADEFWYAHGFVQIVTEDDADRGVAPVSIEPRGLADAALIVEAVNNYDRLRRVEAAMEAIQTKVEAAAYHRNYRAACIDIAEIIIDSRRPVSEVPSDAR